MRILHYTLGFPPARSGGLVGYAIDVMNEQLNQGNEVYALFPGNISIVNKKMHIKERHFLNIKTFELVNSFPLPLMGGIKNPCDFMKSESESIFTDLLKQVRPDVIHVHTLMGIPKEFFIAAKKNDIEIVFTSHDYFGLAPDPKFYYEKKSYDQDNTESYWREASKNAYSTRKLRIFQTKYYPLVRNIVKYISKLGLQKNKENQIITKQFSINDTFETNYRPLRDYYKEIFSLIDKFHFNSNLAKEVYESNLNILLKKSKRVISITNKDIYTPKNDILKKKSLKTRVAYVGPKEEVKGFFDFIKLSELLGHTNYEFHTYGYDVTNDIKGIKQHGKYKRDSIQDVYKDIDILVVPSKWKETFGLVALEGKAYQTIVYLSENVGSKDLFKTKYQFKDIEELAQKIENNSYEKQNKNVKNIETHVKELIDFY